VPPTGIEWQNMSINTPHLSSMSILFMDVLDRLQGTGGSRSLTRFRAFIGIEIFSDVVSFDVVFVFTQLDSSINTQKCQQCLLIQMKWY
jgi:hypothetical protein